MERQRDRYMKTDVQKDINSRIYAVGIWVFTVKFFQLSRMFKIFHNKILGGNQVDRPLSL